jgi:hypothetical protein
MEAAVGMLAFAALIGAQFLAVICVHNERTRDQAEGRHQTIDEARVWNMWLHG